MNNIVCMFERHAINTYIKVQYNQYTHFYVWNAVLSFLLQEILLQRKGFVIH